MYRFDNNLTAAQRERLERFETTDSVDIHCHCLPGLDDGPDTLEESLDLCRALTKDGITKVIATPHQLGRYDGMSRAKRVRAAVDELNVALEENQIPLTVLPGADVRVDERIPILLETGTVLTEADAGRHLLIELLPEIFVELKPLIVKLAARGIKTIISHPERNWFLARCPLDVRPWLAEGASLQITAGSLLNKFGPEAKQNAWMWLESGMVDLVASDAHDTVSRKPLMSAAIKAIAERLGHMEARRICIENPLRVLKGQDLLTREKIRSKT